MTDIAFVRDITFEPGVCDRVSPLIRRVIASNPGPFTYTGTGTYILGAGAVAVIDPGPDIPAHVDAILAALEPGESVSHILVTHTHADHSPAAAPLQARTGAPTHAYGPHGAGQAPGNSGPGSAPVEEGGDMDFTPDHEVRHGDILKGGGWSVECVFTPGHTSNHMCYALHEERALFTGDHVMGWSTSVIAPPDGNMRAYLDSLRLLLSRDDAIYWPTHGPPITQPKPFVESFLAHRRARETQILEHLAAGHTRIAQMVPHMYAAVDPRLHGAAARSVLAHMEHLVETGQISCQGTPKLDSTYAPRGADGRG